MRNLNIDVGTSPPRGFTEKITGGGLQNWYIRVDWEPYSTPQDKSGKISIDELQTICEHFRLPVEEDLLHALISYCDADGDRQIDYEEFCKFLNWENAFDDALHYQQNAWPKVCQILPGYIFSMRQGLWKSTPLVPVKTSFSSQAENLFLQHVLGCQILSFF